MPKYIGAFDKRSVEMLEDSNAPPGSWVCPMCQNANWPKRTMCNRGCGTHRPQIGGNTPGTFPMSQSLGSPMDRMGAAYGGGMGFPSMPTPNNRHPSSGIGFPSNPASQFASAASNGRHPPGSWTCPECHNVNWPHRDTCNAKGCNVKRPAGGGNDGLASFNIGIGRHAGSGNDGLASFGMGLGPHSFGNNNIFGNNPSFGNAKFPSGGNEFVNKLPAGSPPGSWECLRCKNINWPHRTKCNGNNCGDDRPTQIDTLQKRGTGTHPVGSWICPTCSNVNWPQREVCNMRNCETTKPVEVSTIV